MENGDASLLAGAGLHLFSWWPRRVAPLTTHNERREAPRMCGVLNSYDYKKVRKYNG